MNSPRFQRVVTGLFATTVLASSVAAAQLSVERVAATNKTLQHVKASIAKLSPRQRKMLDGYANIEHLANAWQTYGMRLADPSFVTRARLAHHPMPRSLPQSGGVVRVSDPTVDLVYSSMAGFTQSETSTARCGNTVVVGFNDSGSVFETPFYFTGTGGQSFSGSAYSANGGASFTDIGPVNPGPGLGNFLGGDPVINCADASTFFYSQIFDYTDASGNPWAAIALNTSTDGGKSWGDPVAAIAKSNFYHLLDKPWSTVDPSNHKNIYVSYTDFDFTYSSAACGATFRTAIEFVESQDGGVTWSTTPTVAIEVCGNAGVQGSQMAVSSKGTMYISWVNLGSNFPFGPRVIQIESYSGGTLSAATTVEPSVQPGGDSYYLQGEFRDFLDMAMAIDHSGTKTDGTLYVTWADGRDKIVPDPAATQGAYAYDDILLRSSADGKTWSNPVKVNSDFQARLASGHDHYQSGVAVDNRGYVGICWYDRRTDPENFEVRRHCGESTNGFNFTDADVGMAPFSGLHSTDVFINPIYMGDYDQMTSDFLNGNSGFIGAFQSQEGIRGNPDAVAYKLP
ncbi:MAG TPA: sialidase family protein [Candidatus Sulfotelmatobacter sp.]|nr:sialidase family protein [Candidatus Sulfotelmatobacter sp.]